MKRGASLFAACTAIGLAGCILKFDDLTGGGEGGSGTSTGTSTSTGSGGSAPCPACGLCNGACSGDVCEPLGASSESFTPFRVAAIEDVLYAADPKKKVVRRFAPNESPAEYALERAPHAIAVNTKYLLIATAGEGLYRCEREGCGKLAKLVDTVPDSLARQVAADEASLFWITGPDLSSAKVLRCAITSCIPETIADTQDRPHGIALDEEHIYWTLHASGGNGGDGLIRRARKDGTEVITYLAGLNGPSGIAVTGTHLYFTYGVYEGKVLRCALGKDQCGSPEEVTSPSAIVGMQVRTPVSVAATADWVYWTNDGDTTVMACPTAGCATTSDGLPVVMASGQTSPGGILAKGGCAFWASSTGVFAAPSP